MTTELSNQNWKTSKNVRDIAPCLGGEVIDRWGTYGTILYLVNKLINVGCWSYYIDQYYFIQVINLVV